MIKKLYGFYDKVGLILVWVTSFAVNCNKNCTLLLFSSVGTFMMYFHNTGGITEQHGEGYAVGLMAEKSLFSPSVTQTHTSAPSLEIRGTSSVLLPKAPRISALEKGVFCDSFQTLSVPPLPADKRAVQSASYPLPGYA